MQHGLEGHEAIVAMFRAAFPDKVVARTTMRGTQRGEFFGIPPIGKAVSMVGVHVFRIADGKIAEHWGSNDDLSLMRQLGAITDPDA